MDDPLTPAEQKFRALQRDQKAWAAWCQGRRAAWLKAHPEYVAERIAREKTGVKMRAR